MTSQYEMQFPFTTQREILSLGGLLHMKGNPKGVNAK